MRSRNRYKKKYPQLIAASTLAFACLGGMGYMVAQAMKQKVADKFGCYGDIYQNQTAVIIDASIPRWDNVQARALHVHLKELFYGLDFNERLTIFTTERGKISSIAAPSFTACGQASNSQELEEIGAAPASPEYLANKKQKYFNKVVKPQLDQILTLTPDASQQQMFESPVFEMIKVVLRKTELAEGDSLHVISDMIQNTKSSRQCREKNELPLFANFKKRKTYQKKLKPRSLDGADVTVLMLIRNFYGVADYKYCTEDELSDFWRAYFEDNQAGETEFIRIRGTVG